MLVSNDPDEAALALKEVEHEGFINEHEDLIELELSPRAKPIKSCSNIKP